MNRLLPLSLAVLSLAVSTCLAAQEEAPVKEFVSVVNVEVPVRVFRDGHSVPGLGKEDFQISEDGKPQRINGFHVFHKMLNAAPGVADAASPPAADAGRYFVLIFRIYDYNEPLEKGLRHLFASVFRPEDQVLVLANDRTLMIEKVGADAEAMARIQEALRSESLKARNQIVSDLRSIEQNLNMTHFRLTLGGQREDLSPYYISDFLQSYLRTWQDFKRRHLSLEIDKFYGFAQHLEKVRKEKWVLNFYQLEQFPQIAFNSEIKRQIRQYVDSLQASNDPIRIAQGRNIEMLQQLVDNEMKVAKDYPAEDVSKLFYKVNATFHSFFMRTFHEAGNPELEFSRVATDIENCLRSLTEVTGGALIASNDLDAALSTVGNQADDYYVLTYEPPQARKIGKIKVTVSDKKCKVLYDNNIRADYIDEYLKKKAAESPTVKITGLSFQDRKLSFVLSDYSMGKVEGAATAVLAVRIRIKDAGERSVFDQGKNLKTDKGRMSLTLGFDTLAAGKYDVIVDVLDQVSGRTCTEVIQPVVR